MLSDRWCLPTGVDYVELFLPLQKGENPEPRGRFRCLLCAAPEQVLEWYAPTAQGPATRPRQPRDGLRNRSIRRCGLRRRGTQKIPTLVIASDTFTPRLVGVTLNLI